MDVFRTGRRGRVVPLTEENYRRETNRKAPFVQMRPGSGYLASLATLTDSERAVPIVSIWSWHDSMVTPPLVTLADGVTHLPYKWAHGPTQTVT